MEKNKEKLKYNSIIPLVMQTFQTTPKHWGNSLGITIPKDIVEREHLSPTKRIIVSVTADEGMERLKNLFGSLKLKMPTQQAMDEIDKGYD